MAALCCGLVADALCCCSISGPLPRRFWWPLRCRAPCPCSAVRSVAALWLLCWRSLCSRSLCWRSCCPALAPAPLMATFLLSSPLLSSPLRAPHSAALLPAPPFMPLGWPPFCCCPRGFPARRSVGPRGGDAPRAATTYINQIPARTFGCLFAAARLQLALLPLGTREPYIKNAVSRYGLPHGGFLGHRCAFSFHSSYLLAAADHIQWSGRTVQAHVKPTA